MKLLRLSSAIVLLFLVVPTPLLAQAGQSISISPALFELSVVPGQSWKSVISIVNANPYELTVYAEPVLFTPRGEGGDGLLTPLGTEERTGSTLAEWVTIDRNPIIIPAERSINIPYTLTVPTDAPPGGHFAAFTVSTRPPDTGSATVVRTAQVVSSLFFVRVAGEVVERGDIREFRTSEYFLGKPEVDFVMRFQNDGNVHLRPQGDITITNMWGQERGVIPINRSGHFGNVLPDSTRQFNFSWRGEWSLSDIGRYEAVVTLAYGYDERQFVNRTTYFWVVPLMPLLSGVGAVLVFGGLIIWLVRLYVRRLLSIAGVGPQTRSPYVRTRAVGVHDLALTPAQPAVAKMNDGGRPWRLSRLGVAVLSRSYTIGRLLLQQCRRLVQLVPYGRLLLAGILTVILVTAITLYVRSALTPQRSYEVSYNEETRENPISSDALMYEQERLVAGEVEAGSSTSSPVINIINSSGVAGAGATIAMMLEAKGYGIGSVDTDLNSIKGRTVVVYDTQYAEIALALSADLQNALLSAFAEPATTTAPIAVYIGTDVVTEGNSE